MRSSLPAFAQSGVDGQAVPFPLALSKAEAQSVPSPFALSEVEGPVLPPQFALSEVEGQATSATPTATCLNRSQHEPALAHRRPVLTAR